LKHSSDRHERTFFFVGGFVYKPNPRQQDVELTGGDRSRPLPVLLVPDTIPLLLFDRFLVHSSRENGSDEIRGVT
jgi:hypothetical protein